MIIISGLQKSFTKKLVLDIDNLVFSNFGTVALVGNNGAGKTTFLRLLADLLKPTKGKIIYNSTYISELHNSNQIAAYLDETFLIEYLTVEEYFQIVGLINKLDKETINQFTSEWVDFFNYNLFKSMLISELSLGNKNKVGIVGAIMQNKPITLLDEPLANLDPSSQILLCKYFDNIKENTKQLFIISSHNIDYIMSVSNRILLLENGRILIDAEPDNNTIKTIQNYFKNATKQ
ncbi:MAG: ABC transporter ATP-binding protein [Chitinophagaceae bacterium]|nr:ABC transporter ATP-binding protein [Chitinophagaceae bacterium]